MDQPFRDVTEKKREALFRAGTAMENGARAVQCVNCGHVVIERPKSTIDQWKNHFDYCDEDQALTLEALEKLASE